MVKNITLSPPICKNYVILITLTSYVQFAKQPFTEIGTVNYYDVVAFV